MTVLSPGLKQEVQKIGKKLILENYDDRYFLKKHLILTNSPPN